MGAPSKLAHRLPDVAFGHVKSLKGPSLAENVQASKYAHKGQKAKLFSAVC